MQKRGLIINEVTEKMSKKKDNLPTPFNEQPIANVLKSIDSFFQGAFSNFHFGGGFPVHQYETNTHYIIEAELPGIKKEQISLDIYSNQIKISVKNLEVIEEKDDFHNSIIRSRSFQKAERLVMVPFNISEHEVKASYRDGLLKIKFPNKKQTINIE